MMLKPGFIRLHPAAVWTLEL